MVIWHILICPTSPHGKSKSIWELSQTKTPPNSPIHFASTVLYLISKPHFDSTLTTLIKHAWPNQIPPQTQGLKSKKLRNKTSAWPTKHCRNTWHASHSKSTKKNQVSYKALLWPNHRHASLINYQVQYIEDYKPMMLQWKVDSKYS